MSLNKLRPKKTFIRCVAFIIYKLFDSILIKPFAIDVDCVIFEIFRKHFSKMIILIFSRKYYNSFHEHDIIIVKMWISLYL